jgi:Tol biopolymer transport system component
VLKLAILLATTLCAPAMSACVTAMPAPVQEWTASAPARPEKFEPTVVARADTEESMLSVSPDGSQIFWGVSEVWFPMSRVSEIWTARRTAAGWEARERASFSFGYSDGDPFVSPDGRRVYFVSVRPVRGPRRDFDLYFVERTESGFGPARNLAALNSPEDELYPSVATDGTIYFASERSGTWTIYRARLQAEGNYGAPEALPAPVNSEGNWNFNPFISADGRTLVFTSLNRAGDAGKGDIWVARLDAAGEVTSARNIGPVVNTAEDEFHPTLSPDGRALFFIRRTGEPDATADVYWVSTEGLGLR